MKLEKFNKHKKQKGIIMGAILVLIGIIGGISLIASFAMYEEKASFDVLKGTVPDFRIGKGDVNFIALTVNGEKTNTVPLKGTYSKIDVKCDNDALGIWNTEEWDLNIKHITKVPTSCTVDFFIGAGSEWTFDYTGNEQLYVIPTTGRYKLEVWGAQGGTLGGYGGYSYGDIILKQETLLHIYVGGSSGVTSKPTGGEGGYNGGGKGGNGLDTVHYGGSGGGGATHISLATGLLEELENQVNQILIVAGGGGGSGNINGTSCPSCRIGHAGGYIGSSSSSVAGTIFQGGTQDNGYRFGLGQNGRDTNSGSGFTGEGAGGGGGGFYGGTAQESNEIQSNANGAGGSGYIGNALLTNKAMYCYQCKTNEESDTKTILTQSVSSNPISQSAKQGNGYAKITYLGSN